MNEQELEVLLKQAEGKHAKVYFEKKDGRIRLESGLVEMDEEGRVCINKADGYWRRVHPSRVRRIELL